MLVGLYDYCLNHFLIEYGIFIFSAMYTQSMDRTRVLCACILISRSADNHNISILNFDQCQFKSCTTVTIIDDLIDEPVESFNATLDRSPGLDVRITLSPVEAVIEINDNDGIAISIHHVS